LHLTDINSYEYDKQGDNPGQEKEGSTVSSVTVADALINSFNVLAALT